MDPERIRKEIHHGGQGAESMSFISTKIEMETMGRTWAEHYIGNGNDRITSEIVDDFTKLPKQAQGLILGYALKPICSYERLEPPQQIELHNVIHKGCDSPIEYVYAVALCLAWSFRSHEMWEDVEDGDDYKKCADFKICSQYEIDTDGKTYYADFLLPVDYKGMEIDGGQQHQDIVIECDGYEYHHATKEQVNHDNERELAIKKAGYEVLRFSGSQIYNDPFKCANDTVDYIIAEMNRRCIADGTNG